MNKTTNNQIEGEIQDGNSISEYDHFELGAHE